MIEVLVFEVEKRQRGCLGGCVELQLLELTREREFDLFHRRLCPFRLWIAVRRSEGPQAIADRVLTFCVLVIWELEGG